MVLSPLEAIISPQYNKVYKYNLEDGLSIDSIDNKKLRSKRKLVLDALVS